jgi:hypothetical protein
MNYVIYSCLEIFDKLRFSIRYYSCRQIVSLIEVSYKPLSNCFSLNIFKAVVDYSLSKSICNYNYIRIAVTFRELDNEVDRDLALDSYQY